MKPKHFPDFPGKLPLSAHAGKVSPHARHICVRGCDFVVIFQLEAAGPSSFHRAAAAMMGLWSRGNP